jgi:predicted transcriptional regulator
MENILGRYVFRVAKSITITRDSGMTAQAAANHISRLCDAGLLQRLGRQRTKRGMHPQVYDVAGRTNGHVENL